MPCRAAHTETLSRPLKFHVASPPPTADCWFLTGPTASGKTAVGLALAQRLGAEIVSMDSMAVYRGMDIGTAKPTSAEQRQLVPHHLDRYASTPVEELSLAGYVRGGRAEGCRDPLRGREPLVRRRHAVVSEGTAPRHLPGSTGRLAAFAGSWRPSLRARRPGAARTTGRGRSRRGRQAPPSATCGGSSGPWRSFIRPACRSASLQQQFDQGRPADQCRVFVLIGRGQS